MIVLLNIDSVTIATLILAIATAAGVVYTHVLAWKKQKIDGLMTAFKMINSVEHRKAREEMYLSYHAYKESENFADFQKEEVKRVMGDFEVIGLLVKSGNIHKELFLEEYGIPAYLCWKSVSAYVNKERDRPQRKTYMDNLIWLADEAKKYWKEKDYNIPDEPYDPRSSSS